MTRSRERDTLRADHTSSVDTFITAAEATPAAAWELPLSDGKWSPAQVAEHLRLTYETAGRELSGEPGIRIRTSWWLRLLLRARVLPAILRSGRIGGGALAPRELRPGAGPFARDATLANLRQAAATVEMDLMARVQDGRAGLTHHVFGRLPPARTLRFLTVHNLHHARQLTDHAESASGTV
jgi:hypothetical protein